MSKSFYLSKPRFHELGRVNNLLIGLQKSLAALKFFVTTNRHFYFLRLKNIYTNNSCQGTQRASLGVHEWVASITRHSSLVPLVGRELPIAMGPGAGICVHDSVIEIKSLFFRMPVYSSPKWIFVKLRLTREVIFNGRLCSTMADFCLIYCY